MFIRLQVHHNLRKRGGCTCVDKCWWRSTGWVRWWASLGRCSEGWCYFLELYRARWRSLSLGVCRCQAHSNLRSCNGFVSCCWGLPNLSLRLVMHLAISHCDPTRPVNSVQSAKCRLNKGKPVPDYWNLPWDSVSIYRETASMWPPITTLCKSTRSPNCPMMGSYLDSLHQPLKFRFQKTGKRWLPVLGNLNILS